MVRPAIDEVMDAAPTSKIVQAVRKTAGRVEGVVGLEKCRIRKMGLSYYVDLHVTVNGHITVHEGHEIAREVKAKLLATHANVADVLVHIEPSDLLKEKHAD
jgi:divalent metal cation (Fe/Co/Zn/Cd) transporter